MNRGPPEAHCGDGEGKTPGQQVAAVESENRKRARKYQPDGDRREPRGDRGVPSGAPPAVKHRCGRVGHERGGEKECHRNNQRPEPSRDRKTDQGREQRARPGRGPRDGEEIGEFALGRPVIPTPAD